MGREGQPVLEERLSRAASGWVPHQEASAIHTAYGSGDFFPQGTSRTTLSAGMALPPTHGCASDVLTCVTFAGLTNVEQHWWYLAGKEAISGGDAHVAKENKAGEVRSSHV